MLLFKRLIFVGIAIIVAIPAVFSQTYFFDKYSVKDGLAQSNVYSIIQDKSGYLWLGTASGITQFDGIKFINYNTENGLAENGVRSIFEDSTGNIWFGHTGGGITKYNGKEFQEIKLDSLTLNSDIATINMDTKNQLWFGSNGSGAVLLENPYEVEQKKFKFKQFKGNEGLSDRVYSIAKFSDNNLYYLTDVGIKLYNEEKSTFDFYELEDLSYFSQITAMHEDREGNQWFGTYTNGLQKFNNKKKRIEVYFKKDGLAHNFVSVIYSDKQNNIWVGSWGGGLTKITNGKFQVYNTENGFPDNKIRTITEDREGNILIGTNENGIAIYKGEQFINYGIKDGLINEHIWAILKDSKSNYWFGTNAGISVYNPTLSKDEQFKHFNSETNDGFLGNQIRFIKEDKNKNIWIGTWGHGVFHFITAKSKFESNFMINNYAISMSLGNISAMEIDKENNLWIGTSDGLIYHEIDNEKTLRLSNTDGTAGNDISAIYCDDNGIVWIGSRGKGLTRIDGDEISIVELKKKFTPYSLKMDSEGKLWVGTESQGVLVIKDNEILLQLKQPDGLLSDLVTTIDIDKSNNVLIGTNKGLNKYIQKDKRILTYTQNLGFTGIEVKPNASFMDVNGNIWYGTVKGVIKYNPKKERINKLEPATHIIKLRVNLKDREMLDNLVLNYTEKSIAFNFGAICLSDQDEVEYQFMLEGADEDWRPITKQTEVVYSPLPPNKYIFKVKAKNNIGIWNENAVEFAFIIKPPFWKTWWFISIIVLLGIMGIYLFIVIRERNLKREKAILEQKVKQRTIQISEKNVELAKKNKDITDSINYARRIQSAIMHPENELNTLLDDAFIYYRAKDIVSGDFYWFTHKENKTIIVAADCTGHGVPGAFMSMIGISYLNEIVNERGIVDPDIILNELRAKIIAVMQQTGEKEEAKDGMDLALICIDKDKNTLEYSGAYNSLYLVRKDVATKGFSTSGKFTNFGDHLVEIKADRMPIGVSDKQSEPFSKVNIDVEQGDSFYITTDGFIDQFGGSDGKKFLAKRFKEMLVSLQENNDDEHKHILDKTFNNWKGVHEQIDDVLVIGIKII